MLISETPFLIAWFVVALAFGAAWYLLDRHVGTSIYRWLYNMTHQHPLPPTDVKGFVYNRPARVKFSSACMLSAIQSGAALLAGRNPFFEVLSFFIEVPLIMAGFYFGPWAERIWRRKEQVFDKLDDLESGRTSISGEIIGASKNALDGICEAVLPAETKQTVPAGQTSSAPPAAPVNPPPPPEPNAPDARELIDNFVNRRGK